MTHHRDIPKKNYRSLGFILALGIHAVLVGLLIFSISWTTSSPGPVQVELWSAGTDAPTPQKTPTPQPVEPPKPTPEPPKVEPAKPAPEVAPPKTPTPTGPTEAEIAIEKAKERENNRLLAEQKERDRLAKEAEKVERDRIAAEKAAADKAERERIAAAKAAEKAERDRIAKEAAAKAEQERRLINAMLNDGKTAAQIPSGRPNGTDAITQQGGGGGNDEYVAKIRACIRPHVIFEADKSRFPGNPFAKFQVKLLPTGAQASPPRLLTTSGDAGFDTAVAKGISRCDPFPAPANGKYPSTIDVQYWMFN